jgi:hypothetical protein
MLPSTKHASDISFIKRYFFIISCFCITINTSAQSNQYNEESWYAIKAGFTQGIYGMAEIGIASISQEDRHGNFGMKYFSTEIWMGKGTMIAPKIGVWGGGMSLFCFGLNLQYYTDLKRGSLVFRPEAGFGMSFWKLAYGYNAPLTNKNLDRVNRHVVTGVFFIRLPKSK